jgi:N-acetylglucosamine kinase-like BadF-type ATPase
MSLTARAPLAAGFDGGGTRITCALSTLAGEVVSIGTAGPGNLCTHPETAPGEYRNALSAALSGVPEASLSSVTAACVGTAGYYACNVPGGPEAVLVGLLSPDASAEIVSDMEIAWSGAAFGEDAVALVAGTGSVAFGGTRDGARARAGGWGYLLDDEGSAFWIGLRGARAVLRAVDGRNPPTLLTEKLMRALRLSEPEDVEGAVYGMTSTNTEVAALASHVIEAAREGDETALAIANDGGRRLAGMVLAVLRRIDRLDAALPVATVGGVLRDSDGPVRAALIRELAEKAPQAAVTWPELPPVGGALIRALERAEIPLTPAIRDRLTATLRTRLDAAS